MPGLRLSMVLLWTLGLLALCLAWATFGATTAGFESSEGRWSDREISQEGHDFRKIRSSFEEFKQACGRPTASMYRTTARNPFNVVAWWDYIINPKWALPYRPPRVSPVPSSSCDSP